MKNIAADVVRQVVDRMIGEVVLPVLIVFLVSAALIYLIPAIVAFLKRRGDRTKILLVNVLLGWTVIGWIMPLLWALRKKGSSKKRGGGRKRKSSSGKKTARRRKR